MSYVAPKDVATRQIQPRNTVRGDCGSATFYIVDEGGGRGEIDLYFSIKQLANGYLYRYSWYNNRTGNGDSYSGDGDIRPAKRGWGIGDRDHFMGRGYVEGAARLTAYLQGGGLCVSRSGLKDGTTLF
jgi:hypothetical protein